MLNKSKGPAVWSPRAQSDRMVFSAKWREMLEQTPNLDFYQDLVVGLLVDKNSVCGVVTQLGLKIYSKSVILTNGTFLNGLIHVVKKFCASSRVGEKVIRNYRKSFSSLGFKSGRMKTGTPPRVDEDLLNYNKMEEQPEMKTLASSHFYLYSKIIKTKKLLHNLHQLNNPRPIKRRIRSFPNV